MNPDQAHAVTTADERTRMRPMDASPIDVMAEASRRVEQLLKRMDRDATAAATAATRVVFGARARAQVRP